MNNNNGFGCSGGCGRQPVLVSYPYTRGALYQCDCCTQMHQPNTAQFPVSGQMQENGFMVINNVPYLLDTMTTNYGTKLSVSENVYTRISKRNDPSCINLIATFDMTGDIIANAVMKKNARTRNGRLRTNSIQRSLTFTLSVSFLSITTRSLH